MLRVIVYTYTFVCVYVCVCVAKKGSAHGGVWRKGARTEDLPAFSASAYTFLSRVERALSRFVIPSIMKVTCEGWGRARSE